MLLRRRERCQGTPATRLGWAGCKAIPVLLISRALHSVAVGYTEACNSTDVGRPCLYSLCRGLGAISWFPVHCTSINNTNSLISGDNKGVASQAHSPRRISLGPVLSESFRCT